MYHQNWISQDAKVKSLSYLRKPQRIVNQTSSIELDVILKRNTDWNKTHTKYSYDDENIGPEVCQCHDNYYREIKEDVSENFPFKTVNQRSQSLPVTPNQSSKSQFINSGGLKRSKSVHFDEKDVANIRYFYEDESPLFVRGIEHTQKDMLFFSKGQPNQVNELPTTEKSKLRKSNKFKKFVQHTDSEKDEFKGISNNNFSIISHNNRYLLKLNIFLNISHGKYVFLQDLALIPKTNFLKGNILVKNLSYHKRVMVRYTWNHWKLVHDVECVWVSTGEDILPGMQMDIFHFAIDLPTSNISKNPHILEFCILYQVRMCNGSKEYWDNNDNQNYSVNCVL